MSNFEEEVFVEYASVLSSTIDDEKKLELSDDDITELRVYVNELDEYQQQCQVALAPTLQRHGVDSDKVTHLEFPQLTKTLISRNTDVGRMENALQRFRMFRAALKLVKSIDERRLSDELESLLVHITAKVWKMLRENGFPLPEPPRSEHLEKRLNKTTRDFLQEVIGEQNKENVVIVGFTTLKADFTDSDKIDLSAICDVRNYVIVRDLAALITIFKGDVGNFWSRKRRQEDREVIS